MLGWTIADAPDGAPGDDSVIAQGASTRNGSLMRPQRAGNMRDASGAAPRVGSVMTDAPRPVHVEVADPSYGPGMDPTDAETATVDTAVEGIAWRPVRPAEDVAAGPVAFVDGVQQIEAWLTLSVPGEPDVHAGLACAVGAGVVLTAPGRRARVVDMRLERLVMAAGRRRLHLPAVGGFGWRAIADAGHEVDALQRRVGAARQALEHSLAEAHATAERLLVLDGRLSFLRDTPGPVVGAIKSHHRMYLQQEGSAVVAELGVGERTPLFAIGTDRYSWYQRLPVASPRGWSGILRGEVAAGHGVARARELADRATATLPAFAGRPHRDARAPQNLAPIAGLEERLRHRLGDRRLALRAVRRAAAAATLDGAPAPLSAHAPDPEPDLLETA